MADLVIRQSEVSSQKQEVKVFVISPIHHPETAQAAICSCLGAALQRGVVTFLWGGEAALRLTVIIYSLCWAKLSLHVSWISSGYMLVDADPQESTPAWLPRISCHRTCNHNKARACPLYWSLCTDLISLQGVDVVGCILRGCKGRNNSMRIRTGGHASAYQDPAIKKCFLQADNNYKVIKWSNAAFPPSSHEYLPASPLLFLHERNKIYKFTFLS